MAALTLQVSDHESAGLRRRLLRGLGWLALTVYFFQPASSVLDAKLDSSIFSSYAYLTAHGFQYGANIVPLAGPLGFIMYGQVYGGDLFWTRTIGEFLSQGFLAGLIIWFFHRHRSSIWGYAWLAVLLLLSLFQEDLPVAWSLLLTGFLLLQPTTTSVWTVVGAAGLAWFALFKGTDLMLSLGTVSTVATAWALRGNWRRSGLVAGVYLAAFLTSWLLAGQDPRHIPAYVAGTWQLSQGYNDAMGLDEATALFARGAAVILGYGLGLGLTAWLRRRDVLGLAILALLAGYAFVMWKHGFVRADGHVYIFFCFLAPAALAWHLEGVVAAKFPVGPFSRFTPLAAVALVVASLWGRTEPGRPGVVYFLRQTVATARDRLSFLATLPAAKHDLDAKLQVQRELYDLPLTRERIGGASIDFYGYQEGMVPLNGFNYQPRPMGGGAYNAYNRYLMELNRDYVRDPARRPGYYLFKLQTIDGRLPAQDDGLALQELLRRYTPVAVEHDLLLLQALPTNQPPAPPRSLGRRIFRFGENVPVPAAADNEIVLARFQVPLNWAGRLRSLLYKPPLVFAELGGDNLLSPHHRRLVPAMAGTPFLLSPVLEESADFLALYTSVSEKKLVSIRLQSGHERFFARELAVEFLAMPRPPVSTAASTLLPFLHTPVEPITAAVGGQTRQFLAYSLHAPGEFSWALLGTEREFSFTFGIRPDAVAPGRTDGVIFIVETISPAGTVTEVFRRQLDPVAQPADRGPQSASMILPLTPAGSRLILRTDPGPRGNEGWDWSYVTGLRFVHGPLRLRQFPGFNRTPRAVEAEHAAGIDLDSGPVFMLHAPGRLRFDLTGRETRLELEFGLLPGAYTNGGATDGADFVVEVAHADQTNTEIFRRALRPLSAKADQGRQQAAIALPPLAPTDELVVRTTTGPGVDASWDWTYLARLHLQ